MIKTLIAWLKSTPDWEIPAPEVSPKVGMMSDLLKPMRKTMAYWNR